MMSYCNILTSFFIHYITFELTYQFAKPSFSYLPSIICQSLPFLFLRFVFFFFLFPEYLQQVAPIGRRTDIYPSKRSLHPGTSAESKQKQVISPFETKIFFSFLFIYFLLTFTVFFCSFTSAIFHHFPTLCFHFNFRISCG